MNGGIKFPPGSEETLKKFTERLRVIYGSCLISVVLYGSAARGEFGGRGSDINLLIVLADTSLANLARARGLIRSGPFRKIHPVFFNEDEIAASLDVFPIEFLDIKDNGRILYGKDIFKGASVDTRNLRYQCELEIRSRLTMIRSQYLFLSDISDTEKLLFRSLTSSIHIMRNLLRLKGVEPPSGSARILIEVERSCGVDVKAFNEALWARSKGMKLSRAETGAILAGLVNGVEHIARIIDGL